MIVWITSAAYTSQIISLPVNFIFSLLTAFSLKEKNLNAI